MDNDYWLNKWVKNDIAFHQEDANPDLINHICELKLHPGDCIFVPFCGKSRDMLWLAEQGFGVIGVELSAIACNDFFRELGVTPHVTQRVKFSEYQFRNIKLFCGDLFNLTANDLPKIHAVYDCKALIALPPALRKKYLNHIIRCTNTKVKVLLITRESRSVVPPPPYPIDKKEIHWLCGPNFDVKQLKRSTIDEIPERLIKKGYTDITECVYLIS